MSPWLKLDDAMGEHRKTRRLLRNSPSGIGLMAFGMHSRALLHCAQYLTDGFVEREFVDETLDVAKVRGKQRTAIVQALVDGGQWEPVEGGWLAHGFLEHNPSRAEAEERRGVDRFRKELTRDHALIEAIRDRDGDNCRYCSVEVNWKDRRSSIGGTYDHVIPVSQGGENTYDNVVVSCRGCNQKKGSRTPEQAGMFLTPFSGRGRNDLARGLENGQNDLAVVSGSRPVPSRPGRTDEGSPQ